MKYIYKLKYIFLAVVFVFSSCAIDDDAPITVSNDVTYVTLSNSGENFVNVSETPQSFVDLRLSKPLDTNTMVEYTLNGVATSKIFEPGQTSFLFTFDNQEGAVNKVVLTSARGLYNNVQLGDKKSVSFVATPSPSPDNVVVMMTNSANSGNLWLGLSQFSSDGGTWIADYVGSTNGSNPRIANIPLDGNGAFATIPNSADISPNILALNLYPQVTLPNDPTEYSIYVVMPDGSIQSFSGSIPPTNAVDNAVVKVEVTDGDMGNKSYAFSNF